MTLRLNGRCLRSPKLRAIFRAPDSPPLLRSRCRAAQPRVLDYGPRFRGTKGPEYGVVLPGSGFNIELPGREQSPIGPGCAQPFACPPRRLRNLFSEWPGDESFRIAAERKLFKPVDKIPPAFKRRHIRAGRFASPVHAVKRTLHYVMSDIHFATARLRSALLLGRLYPRTASGGIGRVSPTWAGSPEQSSSATASLFARRATRIAIPRSPTPPGLSRPRIAAPAPARR